MGGRRNDGSLLHLDLPRFAEGCRGGSGDGRRVYWCLFVSSYAIRSRVWAVWLHVFTRTHGEERDPQGVRFFFVCLYDQLLVTHARASATVLMQQEEEEEEEGFLG